MLRLLFVSGVVVSVSSLVGCQSISYNGQSPFQKNTSQPNIDNSKNKMPSKSAVDYNKWQWEKYNKKPSGYDNKSTLDTQSVSTEPSKINASVVNKTKADIIPFKQIKTKSPTTTVVNNTDDVYVFKFKKPKLTKVSSNKSTDAKVTDTKGSQDAFSYNDWQWKKYQGVDKHNTSKTNKASNVKAKHNHKKDKKRSFGTPENTKSSKNAFEYNNWQWKKYNGLLPDTKDDSSPHYGKVNKSKNAFEYNEWQWKKYKDSSDQKNTQGVSSWKANWSLLPDLSTAKEKVDVNGTSVWGYNNQKNTVHPNNWSAMPGNQRCSGNMQSPINITKALIPSKRVLNDYGFQYRYKNQDFIVSNNGRTITFTPTDTSRSKLAVNGSLYDLVEFNYHARSEHAIMDLHHPIELQLVHKSTEGDLAIMSVFIDLGSYNIALDSVLDTLPKNNENQKLYNFNLGTLIPQSPFYTYRGSLTAPPCTDNVQWLINATPITASRIQLFKLFNIYNGNSRPIQPLGSREVHVLP